VVDEALDESGNVRSSIWYDKPGVGFSRHGTKYIEQALRWAHKADRHALLFYNEAEGERLNRKSNDSAGEVRADDLTRQADVYRVMSIAASHEFA
jgi:GH35 family endo-1,4-beta-xylanase